MEKKRILIVFPHNFFDLRSGVHKRFYELVRYLKNSSFIVDQLGLKNFESRWNKAKINQPEKLIDNLFLYDFAGGYLSAQVRKGSFRELYGKIIKREAPPSQIYDYAFNGMKTIFLDIVTKNRYDFILFGYVFWADLLTVAIPYPTCRILTIEDFITRNLSEKFNGNIDRGKFLKEELRRVKMFDRIICLSHEEMQFFSESALGPAYYYVPVFMEEKLIPSLPKIYDVLFIGYDNSSNKNGLRWFFDEVYPLLDVKLKILVVGKISKHVPSRENVTLIDYMEDIGEAYAPCRITINPLQDGTGMKVKLIESLSYGIPVVSTPRGLCGIKPEILHDFIIAGDARDFAREIEKLVFDEVCYREQLAKTRKIFKEHFEVSAVSSVLNDIFSVNA